MTRYLIVKSSSSLQEFPVGRPSGHVESPGKAQKNAPRCPHGHAKLGKTNIVTNPHPNHSEWGFHCCNSVTRAQGVRFSAWWKQRRWRLVAELAAVVRVMPLFLTVNFLRTRRRETFRKPACSFTHHAGEKFDKHPRSGSNIQLSQTVVPRKKSKNPIQGIFAAA